MAIVRKKPVEVEARRLSRHNVMTLLHWIRAWGGNASKDDSTHAITIETLEGPMKVSTGWWIIKGVENEFYPCKPDIFDKTYDIIREK